MSEKKIMLRLGIFVHDGVVNSTELKYSYEENDKTFSLNLLDKDNAKFRLLSKPERLKKEKFTVVDSNYREDSSVVSYFIYCFPEDKSDCMETLIERVKKRLTSQIAGLQKELDALEKFKAERKKK